MLQGYQIALSIYAESPQEAEEARQALIAFIEQHRRQGRAVRGKKIKQAVQMWDKNPFVKNKIISFLNG